MRSSVLTREDIADVPPNQTVDDSIDRKERQHPIKSELRVDHLIADVVPLNSDATDLKQGDDLTGVTERCAACKALKGNKNIATTLFVAF